MIDVTRPASAWAKHLAEHGLVLAEVVAALPPKERLREDEEALAVLAELAGALAGVREIAGDTREVERVGSGELGLIAAALCEPGDVVEPVEPERGRVCDQRAQERCERPLTPRAEPELRLLRLAYVVSPCSSAPRPTCWRERSRPAVERACRTARLGSAEGSGR